MESKVAKAVWIGLGILLFVLLVWKAVDVFLLAFAAVLLAIFLNTLGQGMQRLTRLPYPLALLIALVVIIGLITLTFWHYMPLIIDQSQTLINQLPQSMKTVSEFLEPVLGKDFMTNEMIHKTFSLSNQKFVENLLTVFSVTIGSLVAFFLFIIIGIYFSVSPRRYVQWVLYLVAKKNRERVWEVMVKIEQSLRWWLLGKVVSMMVIGVLTFIGLHLLNVSLAFILAFLAALLAFIPYVGAILSSIPAILVAFTQSPLLAVYVTCLYVVIHVIEGYLITPFIEQRTVAIPPALTILMQVLFFTLVGPLGLALATPLTVVGIALAHYSLYKTAT